MNKELLIKHINGEGLTEEERRKVISWIDESERNEEYYLGLMESVIAEKVTRQTSDVVISREEKRASFAAILSRINGFKVAHTLPFADSSRRKIKWLTSLSACAVILLFLSVTLNYLQYSKNNMKESADLSGSSAVALSSTVHNEQTFYTENGVKAKIMLPDSSVVWLNSGSSITYPQVFAKEERVVKFSGEGYFEVRENKFAPMIVTTPRGMQVKVLGTKFYICSYDDDSEEHATLFSGKINISRVVGNKVVVKEKEMKPMESVNFTGTNRAVLISNSDTTKKVAWRHGELLFDKTPMPDVIKKLERWHGVDIVVKDSVILKHSFTAKFSTESVVQIMELLEFTTPVDFKIENNKVFLSARKN